MATLTADLPTRSARQTSDITLGILLLVVVGALTVAPVVYVLVSSFNVAPFGKPFQFSLSGWEEVFTSPKTLKAIGYSILLSIRIPIGIAIAFVIAWLLVRVRIPGATFIEHALWFGFFLPPLPITMGWILLMEEHYGLLNHAAQWLQFVNGPVFSIFSVGGIIWVHLTLSTIPVMIILLAPALRQLDAANEEAADMAGASTATALWRITIPLVAPAILTAFIAGFIRSLEVFEIEQILGTPAGIFVYATRIYDLISWEPPLIPQAMALSALFLIVLLAIAMIYQRLLPRIGGRVTLAGKSTRIAPRISSWKKYLASGIIIFYLLAAIALPLVVLLAGSLTRLFGFFFVDDPWTFEHWHEVFADTNFRAATVNSVLLGLSAGGIGTFLYALIAWVLTRRRVWGAALISLFTWLPWAVPGLVLGMALLSLTLNTPLLAATYGTLAPLIIAMVIKDMPFGVQMVRTSLFQVSTELEESAAMSGAGFAATFRRIVLPLVAPMLVAVFLLMFMATVRDISTIVLLAGSSTRTLSLLMFEFANSGRFESSAVIGILIALISLAIIAIAFRVGLKLGIER